MIRKFAYLGLFIAGQAFALPAEDHWSPDPDTPFAKDFAKAETMLEVEDYCGALPLLVHLSEAARGNPDVFNLLGYAYRKSGDLESSGEAYARALFLDPDHHGALEYQGELFLTLDNIAAAEANLAKLTASCPSPCVETDELAAAIAAWRTGQDAEHAPAQE